MLAAFVLIVVPCAAAEGGTLNPTVEAEETIYSFEDAGNGAGPMWCHGNTCIVRVGEDVFASGLKRLPGAKPLNNCVPLLFQRGAAGWTLVYEDAGRTREPSPLVTLPVGRLFLSINPTLTAPDTYAGPAKPQVLEFAAASPRSPAAVHEPLWQGTPAFSEHSYRSFVADGEAGELFLLQNIGYEHAEWSFRDREGAWKAQGQLVWPWGATYEKPQAIRLCYPAVALKGRAVHVCGVSDIIEPNATWRAYKKELTGRDWDYDFRRLFYASCVDIGGAPFSPWLEVASREATCGWIFPMDLHVAPSGDVFVLWNERALDERLREKFFPGERQRFALELAVLRRGEVVRRATIAAGGEGLGGERPGDGRFHLLSDGRLLVICYVGGAAAGGSPLAENHIVEIAPDGTVGPPVTLPLKQPLGSFFTAGARGGCRPTDTVDLMGSVGASMRYARVRLR